MNKVLFICLLVLLVPFKTAFGGQLTVRVPMDVYPPFFTKSETGLWTGLSIELAEALLGEAGVQPVYKPLPFKRALKYLERGELDMMLNLTITPERAAYINFIGPQLDETVVLVVPQNASNVINSLEDIKKLPRPISVEVGKVYGAAFEEKRRRDKAFARHITEVSHEQESEEMLATAYTSGFLGYGYHIFLRFKTNPAYANFKVHPYKFHQDWVHYGFSKKAVSSETLRRLQQAFERLHAMGILEKIRQRYSQP